MKPINPRLLRESAEPLRFVIALLSLVASVNAYGDIKVKGFPYDEKYQLPKIDPAQQATWVADYIEFAESMDVAGFGADYPQTARDLRSDDPKARARAVKVCVASGDVRSLPLIVEELRCSERSVQVEAGFGLEGFIKEYEYNIIRRIGNIDSTLPMPPPLRKGDVDLRSLRWVFQDMLRSGEPNLQGYACDIVGFLGLKEFEPTLRALHESRNPACYHAVESALRQLGLTYEKRKDDYVQPIPVPVD